MSQDEQGFDVRPGRVRDRGAGQGRRAVSLATQVRRAAAKAGHMRLSRARRSGGTGMTGRGRLAAASARFRADGRRVVIKARIVRHKGARFDALGATWIDRQLVGDQPLSMANGFGREVRDALDARREKLVALGVATRRGGQVILPSGMIASLRASELQDAATRIAQATGLAHQPSAPGEIASGQYRQRVTLASGRFAMIDDGLGFQLVPWRPALDRQLGSQVLGTMNPGGRIDWSPGRSRGLGL